MSINFDIMKWPARPTVPFPISFEEAPRGSASVPWLEMKAHLLRLGARENFDEDNLWLDLEDDSTLEIWGIRDSAAGADSYVSIAFKVHAYWTHVLALFRKALEYDSDLVLFDPQEGVFHTDKTFEPLAIAQHEYARKKA